MEKPLAPASIDAETHEISSCSGSSRHFGDLRSVKWRIDLGILPSSPSASIDDLRRVTANSRRRYAGLRRQLLVDPHVLKDGDMSPDLVMDNPLSQNPGSMWGRFFRNAELERMVDQDLTRLYPERCSYFQTTGCQGILRRILLLWCLRHPEYGYRQGMHELLAPLLYVLHVDVERLSEVRKSHEDHFVDKFDGFSFHETDLSYKFDFKKLSESLEDKDVLGKSSVKVGSPTELDPKIQTIISLSDAYGAEGELGMVLSEKFMEHDAYSMFDALMSGAGGASAMAEFFSHSPFFTSHHGFPPVIEASAVLYHLLSTVDSSLHSHLVELGVEPQYFALRWLRVLFGREFSLEDLLAIWDEIFSFDNNKFERPSDDFEANCEVLNSPRGAFISSFAVSMILTLRSSLLATENATACLQRLLNFPGNVDFVKLVAKAKSLQALAVDANNSTSLLMLPGLDNSRKPLSNRDHSLSLDWNSPRTPLNTVPESYWEEKWRVLHKEQENKQGVAEKQVSHLGKAWLKKVRLRLSRTESDPLASKASEGKKESSPSPRRSLLEDLAQQLRSDGEVHKLVSDEDSGCENRVEANPQDVLAKILGGSSTFFSGHAQSELDSSDFLDQPGLGNEGNDQENESGRSSIASNLYAGENDSESNTSELCGSGNDSQCSPLPISDSVDVLSTRHTQNEKIAEKSAPGGTKEQKILLGRFQWLWKLGRNANHAISEREDASRDAKACDSEHGHNNIHGSSSAARECAISSETSKGETVDQNLMVSLRNIGQSMLENIQVLESVLQQNESGERSSENLSRNGLVGERRVTAMAALEELRKISNLLSEI